MEQHGLCLLAHKFLCLHIIAVIAFANNTLTGTVPTEMGNLNALAQLWLEDNPLTGTIPSEMGKMTSLGKWLLLL